MASSSELAGIQAYVPPPPEAGAMWQLVGSETQILEVSLPPGGVIYTEPGTMVHTTPELKATISTGKCCQAFKRSVSGETIFRLKYVNEGQSPQTIGVTRSYPGQIIPIDLERHSGLVINDGAFLCNIGENCRFNLMIARSLGAACCGGKGFILTTLNGSGMAFLNAMGTVITKTLQPGEIMLADTHSVLAFDQSVQYSVRRTGNCKTMMCGGEGLFNTKLTGPGVVWLQSMTLHKLVNAVAKKIVWRETAKRRAASSSAAASVN